MTDINWDAHEALSERWKSAGRTYAAAINAFVAKGNTEGWDAAGDEPTDPRAGAVAERDTNTGVDVTSGSNSGSDAEVVLELVRRAQGGEDSEGTENTARLRAMFPPMFAELANARRDSDAWIGPVVYVAPGVILARRGDPWAATHMWELRADGNRLHRDLRVVGRSPQHRVVALGRDAGVELRRGWEGETLCTLPWPNGTEGIPAERKPQRYAVPKQLDELTPFDDGQRALLVSSAGVFLLTPDGARLLYPDDALLTQLMGLPDRKDEPGFCIRIDMQHAGLSPDGKLMAVGAQDGRHLVLNDTLEVVARIGPHGEYPHRAWFSEDGAQLALNACHFYNGGTIRVAVADLPGLDTEFYAEDPRIVPVNNHARVYAAVGRGPELILGDAYGYLEGVSTDTGNSWRHFVGGNITGMDLSPDGTELAVGTMSGTVHVLALDAGADPYRIGTSPHVETLRWMLEAGDAPPLRW